MSLQEELRLEEERKKKVEAAVAAASFDQLDTNKDGVITREEFQDFVQKVQNETSGTLVEEAVKAELAEWILMILSFQQKLRHLTRNRYITWPPPSLQQSLTSADPSCQDEDPETIQERVNEVLEENSRLRSENEALRV
ncbi:unnamed protein product [Cladocopium goreaui]|uniref:EF-hand domain-containing protein n=1 Tax=Cladocopium goreaui TaxID=2562237 RepID=A0A9P1C830_9DINO|nr:unnamed protein product [Cladocopium goreaui]